MLDFVRFPGQWQALRQDPSLARNAFEEVVRIEAPVTNFFRTTSQATELAGTRLPADAKVMVSFAGANRDPGRWERPDEFDIRRKCSGHMGYGTGVHNCVGQVIARMEGEAVFGALAARVASGTWTASPAPGSTTPCAAWTHCRCGSIPPDRARSAARYQTTARYVSAASHDAQ